MNTDDPGVPAAPNTLSFEEHNMTISFNGQTLNQSRLDAIMQSNTAEEAQQRMGLFDKIKDWFRGGVEKAAIKEAFDLLKQPKIDMGDSANLAKQESLLHHFTLLRSATQAPFSDHYALQVDVDESARTWSYSMRIDENKIIQCQNLPIGNGYTLEAFKDAQMLMQLGNTLHKQTRTDPQPLLDRLQEQLTEMNAMHSGPHGAIGHNSARLEKLASIANTILKEYGTSPACSLDVSSSPAGLQATLSIGPTSIDTIPLNNREDLTDALILNQSITLGTLGLNLSSKDPDQAIMDAVQDMVDGEELQEAMRNQLNDPTFSHANFIRITTPDPETSGKHIFYATFRDPSNPERERTLEFSNRPGSNGELRGARLQDMLSNGRYGSLAGLIGQVHGTAEDAQVIYATNGARLMLTATTMMLKSEATGTHELFKDDSEVDDYIRNLNTQFLGSMSIGKTHYAEVAARCEWPLWESDGGSAPSLIDTQSSPRVVPLDKMV